jgi:CRISP-associated protein Cas1
MLRGRLGLESADVPQSDRHGLLWLSRGQLYVENGTLRFLAAGSEQLESGDYAIPFQMINAILLGPGTTVSHDALRLLARHGTALVATGEGGVRYYASLPAGPDRSARARAHAELWANPVRRIGVARRMYAWRLGEVVPATDLAALRGIEGARVKRTYAHLAAQYGTGWAGRRYDRAAPESADVQNQAVNHAATALYAAANVAVAVTGAIPQLGFIHENSGYAFSLDIADLFRETVALPVAFAAVRDLLRGKVSGELERIVRQRMGGEIRRGKVVAQMIDRIKELLDADDGGGDP